MPSVRRSPLHEKLKHVLVERRLSAKLTQVQLAERLGRPQSFVSKIESGERRLDVIELLEVAAAIGCNAGDILAELKPVDPPATSRRRPPKSTS